jgi:hypothetical protein
VTLDIYVSRDQRDPNLRIRSLEVYVLRVATVPVVPRVPLGAQMETSIFSREARVLQIASNAGVVTIAKASKYWFLAQVVCIAHLEL